LGENRSLNQKIREKKQKNPIGADYFYDHKRNNNLKSHNILNKLLNNVVLKRFVKYAVTREGLESNGRFMQYIVAQID